MLNRYPGLAEVGVVVVGAGVVTTVGVTTGGVTTTGATGASIVNEVEVLALCPFASVAYTVMVCVPTSFCVGVQLNEPEEMLLFESVDPLNESTSV